MHSQTNQTEQQKHKNDTKEDRKTRQIEDEQANEAFLLVREAYHQAKGNASPENVESSMKQIASQGEATSNNKRIGSQHRRSWEEFIEEDKDDSSRGH